MTDMKQNTFMKSAPHFNQYSDSFVPQQRNFNESMSNSPSLLFDVTDVMSRHRGRSHVADEGKELITWHKKD